MAACDGGVADDHSPPPRIRDTATEDWRRWLSSLRIDERERVVVEGFGVETARPPERAHKRARLLGSVR